MKCYVLVYTGRIELVFELQSKAGGFEKILIARDPTGLEWNLMKYSISKVFIDSAERIPEIEDFMNSRNVNYSYGASADEVVKYLNG